MTSVTSRDSLKEFTKSFPRLNSKFVRPALSVTQIYTKRARLRLRPGRRPGRRTKESVRQIALRSLQITDAAVLNTSRSGYALTGFFSRGDTLLMN